MLSRALSFSLTFSVSLQCVPALAKPIETISPEAVADRLEGLLVYQADDYEIHMRSCAVQWQSSENKDVHSTDQAPAVYLYQEQARDDRLNQPYRQRLLKISATSPETVTSDSFRLTAPEDWIGLCRDNKRDRTFTKRDLLPAHCTVTLTQEGRKFVGSTPEPGCPSNYRGATFVRNRIILSNQGMKTFDQGVDAKGNRVWGAEDAPYRFRKVFSP